MSGAAHLSAADRRPWVRHLPLVVGGAAFAWLFWEPFALLLRDWWNEPEASHGLLLGPLAGYLIWKSGVREGSRPQPLLGVAILAAAVLLRIASALAAELFTMRLSMVGAAIGLAVWAFGIRQVGRWWLPVSLLILAIPLPAVVLSNLALPLQLRASQMGATMLEWRDVPVQLSGNVIHLPGRSLFVTEACSGLRSLTALISLGLLMAGVFVQRPWLRGALVFLAVPVAMLINGVRVFLTGFLVFFVDPALGDGFMHLTEGWALFVVAFVVLSATTWAIMAVEQWLAIRSGAPAPAGSAS